MNGSLESAPREQTGSFQFSRAFRGFCQTVLGFLAALFLQI